MSASATTCPVACSPACSYRCPIPLGECLTELIGDLLAVR